MTREERESQIKRLGLDGLRVMFPVGTSVFHMNYSAELRQRGARGYWPIEGYERDAAGRIRVSVGDAVYLPEDLAVVPELP